MAWQEQPDGACEFKEPQQNSVQVTPGSAPSCSGGNLAPAAWPLLPHALGLFKPFPVGLAPPEPPGALPHSAPTSLWCHHVHLVL